MSYDGYRITLDVQGAANVKVANASIRIRLIRNQNPEATPEPVSRSEDSHYGLYHKLRWSGRKGQVGVCFVAHLG